MQNGSNIQPTDLFKELFGLFSSERLEPYLGEHKSREKAILLYSWNIELSKSLYPSVQVLEVTMRNALHNVLSDHFQTTHWFDDGFFIHQNA